MTEPTTFAPAVLASDASSPSGSRGSAVERGRITPTSTARSCLTVSSVRLSSATGRMVGCDGIVDHVSGGRPRTGQWGPRAMIELLEQRRLLAASGTAYR